MGVTNLSNFYFKKGSSDTYDATGEYASVADYIGTTDKDTSGSLLPLCNFFSDYNTENTSKVREHVDAPTDITKFDSTFTTTPLWTGKTFKAGVDCKPARKYDIDVLSHLTLTNAELISARHTNITATSGLLLIQGGGGGGGGGDPGGWLDEPSGGGGGGSGGCALMYFRYKTLNPTKTLLVDFSTDGIGGAGGATESPGETGPSVTLYYNVSNLESVISCTGGDGGRGSNTADTNAGGSGGTVIIHKSVSGDLTGTDRYLINDDDLYLYLIWYSNGLSGQNSGQHGASGSANSFSSGDISVPSIGTQKVLNYSQPGGTGGKKDASDPGGGGGAASAIGSGGNGSTGDAVSTAGGPGAGGGGGAERNTASASGGMACAVLYS